MSQPGLIRYNIKDRGRKHLGQDRNFDIKKLCDSINGGATQERVKTRGMLGYYGHEPRKLAGMNIAESVVIAGKYNELEPALITTYLKAFPNGDIEHQSEFLETESGKKAALMNSQKIGGFSSAIKDGSYEFYGFDYVLMPNFSSNRSYLLDSANVILDDIVSAAHGESEQFWQALLSKKDSLIEQLSMALDSCQSDNEAMINILANGKNNILDDASFSLPSLVSSNPLARLNQDVEIFRSAKSLPQFQDLGSGDKNGITEAIELINQFKGR